MYRPSQAKPSAISKTIHRCVDWLNKFIHATRMSLHIIFYGNICVTRCFARDQNPKSWLNVVILVARFQYDWHWYLCQFSGYIQICFQSVVSRANWTVYFKHFHSPSSFAFNLGFTDRFVGCRYKLSKPSNYNKIDEWLLWTRYSEFWLSDLDECGLSSACDTNCKYRHCRNKRDQTHINTANRKWIFLFIFSYFD